LDGVRGRHATKFRQRIQRLSEALAKEGWSVAASPLGYDMHMIELMLNESLQGAKKELVIADRQSRVSKARTHGHA